MKLKELNIEERPRERLIAKGSSALGNAELLAILLRTGSGNKNVLEMSHELLAAAGSLTELSAMSIDKMQAIGGIGKNKAATVTAAFELGRRFAAEGSRSPCRAITNASQIFSIMFPVLKGIDHEECWILYLNRANHILYKEKVSTGGLSSTTIDTNSILRKAIEKKADGIILVHNHPSGNPQPGKADVVETERLKKAAETFSISMLDHVIISDSGYYSFADQMIYDSSQISVAEVHETTRTLA
ncbi:MAG: DNA repair protein RadC [Bacteroidales bacterium]|mgnify:FL=1|uniref:RadC family protein n=1 Tax=Candidatus Cryptobacteroides bacterium TaxID=3085639 RepID=UPI001ED49B49|nr:DNA repair protein RadC [Bacteroidales bacterium]